MKRITSVITTKLLAVTLLLLMLGFTPAFGQVNPLQPASKPTLKTPARRAPGAVHRRKHRRHRRRRVRRIRRNHRRAVRRHHVPASVQNNQKPVAH